MRLYHGTKKAIESFDPYLVGSGFEPNSALGVWTSTSAHIASGYAGDDGCVLVAEAGPLRLASCHDYHSAIWGGPDLLMTDREISMPMFEAARERLMAEGFDGVWTECPGTDLEGCVCVFDVAKLAIVSVMEAPSEEDLDLIEGGSHDEMEVDFSVTLEDALAEALQNRAEMSDLCP